MRPYDGIPLLCALMLSPLSPVRAQAPAKPNPEFVEKAAPSVALVLAADSATTRFASGLIVKENGVLLTASAAVKDARAVQVRLRNGETFDDVQLLGVDARRGVAALKIAAARLPVLPVANADDAKTGEPVTVIAHPMGLPWSVSTGILAAQRMADEVPGAGSGYRLIQFTAASSDGAGGGVLLDASGGVLGLIVGSARGGQNLNFAVPIGSLLGLADAPPSKSFANGSALVPPAQLAARSRAVAAQTAAPSRGKEPVANPTAAEKSDALAALPDRIAQLRAFKTMYVDATRAQYFGADQMKAALARNKGFAALNITIVDDASVADTVLRVGYTFAWDYPFELRHQNSSMVLVAGKGHGPFSGPAGAASVAEQFVTAIRSHRVGAEAPRK